MSIDSPLTRLRLKDKWLMFGSVLLLGTVTVYLGMIGTEAWNDNASLKTYSVSNIWRKSISDNWYKGRANLHAFEDWCGKSIAELRKNPHYPLYPHSRSTVLKLAVIPKWTNYGLRIFGYLHPYTDGEFVFALSSQDNSELWLSTDDSPLNLELLGWVGKTGTEWTAPGEFEKYVSQISRPLWCFLQRKYFFELLHKQDHEGTDHVEVGSRFTVIESKHISLYVDESAMVVGDVEHIPQTAASHSNTNQSSSTVDMLREDPRDVLFHVPLINSKFLQDVLPDCEYKPSYTYKGSHLGRYQGLNYVKSSFIYPNDHTRLTQMESVKSCFYQANILENSYMNLDSPDLHTDRNQNLMGEKSGDYYETDDETFAEKFRQVLLSLPVHEDDTKPHPQKTQIVSEEQRIVKRSLKLLQVKNDVNQHWRQTFQINNVDYRAHNSDAMEMSCNIAGSLLINSNDVLPVVKDFMDKLNKEHEGQFTLVKRVDHAKGIRYLLELLLKDMKGQMLRLSQYVYATTSQPEPVLCNPVAFSWNPLATVHIIVPVKNQARWVHKLITEMEKVFRESGDTNFNLIVTDYDSSDMDVEKALKKSSLHRYQYLKLRGNFQRSAGLQAGIDLIKDPHSIVFLCDLHLQFPTSIINSIRKHSVEGHMAFAPIVLRLDCGSSPLEARGFWEVQGFGLLGIYKSDLDAVGGMNTREFTDRWGGEDWELLDRIIKSKLEVDRIYLRNFFHYFHSKRGMWSEQL
ncbi:beta-1,4-N-acetylgalactosaminyltransferase 3-like [Limanda limanda]|uniref:beta-1,4-N-acetylgalactosaminyltransferase 3-like n=1 Tax=Limanda limanda TaxID=27771 RepID=UPI0029C8D0E3|nr:beta-1,4-N-acetylgalactosaminyltransferase 3-like [Limanda limanda]